MYIQYLNNRVAASTRDVKRCVLLSAVLTVYLFMLQVAFNSLNLKFLPQKGFFPAMLPVGMKCS